MERRKHRTETHLATKATTCLLMGSAQFMRNEDPVEVEVIVETDTENRKVPLGGKDL